MHLSATQDNDTGLWGAVPDELLMRSSLRRARSSVAVRKAPNPPVVEADVFEEAARNLIAQVQTSLAQTVTSVLLESADDQVGRDLERLWETTSQAWEFLLHMGKASGEFVAIRNLKTLAQTAHRSYPKPTGREYVRAAIYLNADVVEFVNEGELPNLKFDPEFLSKHYMLNIATLIAYENLKVSEAATEAVAGALWAHWVEGVERLFAGSRLLEDLIEDAYLKGSADEAELEQGDEPWETWRDEEKPRVSA